MPKDETPAKQQNPLLVLGKISAILDSFSLRQPVMSLADIREATNLPASTVQRLVANLVGQGFLDREDDGYRIGMKMAYWAAPATRGREVLDVIIPSLRELRDFTGETACLFRAEQHYRVCVGIAETRHALRREMHLGELAPLHAGSAGRVLLAWKPELMQRLQDTRLEPLTDATITGMASLEQAVAQTRADGFAITTGERENGASGLSAPVFDSAAGLVAAVTISGPTMRMPREQCESWIEPLLDTAERMTRLIGGRFPGETHRPAV
ncbi:IclR family transcriptional regulator [Glutamicibacter mysorens]|uniref:IclR family transcriptional regulator n=1 Tax=Glutamicibacter mysorens TaxID=257984 RepID=A0ABX4MZX0_9MICC|nr:MULTISPECIES: IclR family transcriptional regulator [Glutamicibacter]KWR72241.1 IclR family transcriptional regulator [Arthrobacter sp. W1]PJJ43699.1 IclR family transcriptional regulator [Glutamicibacter mysorens]